MPRDDEPTKPLEGAVALPPPPDPPWFIDPDRRFRVLLLAWWVGFVCGAAPAYLVAYLIHRAGR